jgi:ABC-type cobalt transport system substrate-binding protein
MKRLSLIFLTAVICLLLAGAMSARAKEESWPGVDTVVVEKYAAQAGRPAREPYINTDQGDLLLFMFALAGTVGGFIMGYYWRGLFGSPLTPHPPEKTK